MTLRRYFDIRTHFHHVDEDIRAYRMTASEEYLLGEILRKLNKIDAVVKELQEYETNILETRLMFNSLLTEYDFGDYIATNSPKIRDPNFETGVYKLQNDMANGLNAEEAFACRRLAIPNEIPPAPIAQDAENEMQALIREHKRRRMENNPGYIDTRFIRPTSNLCERFFSKAKRTAHFRYRLGADTFEWQLF